MAKQIVWALNFEVFELLFKESTGIEDSPEVQTIIVDDTSGVACILLRVTEETHDIIAKQMVESGDFQLVPDMSEAWAGNIN